MKRKATTSTGKTVARLRPPIPQLERHRMESELRAAEERIALSALDALSTHLAILDAQGKILATNRAWREFGRGAVGKDYFQTSGTVRNGGEHITKFAEGVHTVLVGKSAQFAMEYPWQGRDGERWFQGKASRFAGKNPVRVLIAHEEISQRVRLEREIVAVSAREQQRFGQELHDGLSQHLTGLKFKASLLEYQLQSKELPEASDAKAISELLNDATEEASKLARSVRPVELESRGLMMALHELAAHTTHAHRVKCTCEIRRPVFLHDNNVATNVYRIAEEAITNALQHGEATEIAISLSENRVSATLTIRDNGRGLPKKSTEEGGLGLHMMRYRARMIGGSIELRPNTVRGLIVNCDFQKRPVGMQATGGSS